MLWAGKLWEASYFVRGVGEGVTAAMIDNYIDQHSEKAVSFKQLELFPKGKE
jgi:REP element-mobilizing transposase RayT